MTPQDTEGWRPEELRINYIRIYDKYGYGHPMEQAAWRAYQDTNMQAAIDFLFALKAKGQV